MSKGKATGKRPAKEDKNGNRGSQEDAGEQFEAARDERVVREQSSERDQAQPVQHGDLRRVEGDRKSPVLHAQCDERVDVYKRQGMGRRRGSLIN